MHPNLHIFGIKISSYLLLAAVGLIAGLLLGEFTRRKISLSRGGLIRFVLSCSVGAVIGAKLLYLLVEWESFLADPVHALTGGGFVFYGGLLLSFVTGLLWCRKTRTPYLPIMDIFIPGVTLFHAFGRVGCLLAGCCYGIPTNSNTGIIYPEGSPAPAGVRLFPAPIYEAVFLLILTAALLITLKYSRRHGTVFGVYLSAYSLWRFLIEFYRSDPRGMILGISTSQFISIFIFLGGLLVLVRRKEAENLPSATKRLF